MTQPEGFWSFLRGRGQAAMREVVALTQAVQQDNPAGVSNLVQVQLDLLPFLGEQFTAYNFAAASGDGALQIQTVPLDELWYLQTLQAEQTTGTFDFNAIQLAISATTNTVIDTFTATNERILWGGQNPQLWLRPGTILGVRVVNFVGAGNAFIRSTGLRFPLVYNTT